MIAQMELAILQQLVDASDDGRLPYRWAVTETFPDDLNAYLENVRNLRTPAAWVSWISASNGDDSDGSWRATHRFVLAIAATTLADEEIARHGAGDKPGSYQLAEDAVRVLSGNWLEPLELLTRPISVLSFAPLARTEQMKTQKLSAIALVLECQAQLPGFDAALGEFRQLHVDWDVPVHGNVTPPLPAEDPDAADLIEVPQ